jgi:hypothetical protein
MRLPFIAPADLSTEQRPIYERMRTGIGKNALRFSAELGRAVAERSNPVSSIAHKKGQSMPASSEAPPPTLTSRTVTFEHISIESSKPFRDVCAALEMAVPPLDPAILNLLADGDVERVDHEREHGPELSIFLVRDHGALLQIAGRARSARQYDIGNAITASLMTRHQLAAAQYAPIRVVLYENDAGHAVFEYDRPSSLFGQFDDEQVNVVARGLDAALARALLGAAS